MDNIDFYHQFIITSEPLPLTEDWVENRLLDKYLMTHKTLPLRRLLDRQGLLVGFALGWLIDPKGHLLKEDIQLDFRPDQAGDAQLDQFVYRFGGRFAFLFLSPEKQRLYLDNGGTLAAVYNRQRKRAASTLTLLVGDEPHHPIFSRSPSDFPGDRINQYWPADLTPDQQVRRLLPNHYLDLRQWRAVRHYPSGPFQPLSPQEIPFHLQRIVRTIRRNILAVVQEAPITYMNLTAGEQTRTLLACARGFTEKIDFLTFDYRAHDNYQDHFADLDISTRLAKRYNLRHHILPIKKTLPPEDVQTYMLRTGFAGHPGKARDFYDACGRHLDLSGALLTGFGGGRPPSWVNNDFKPDQESAAFLLGRLWLPVKPVFVEAVAHWLGGLPGISPATVFAMAHLEMRLGGWASAHLYGAAPMHINLIPFRHRDVSDAQLRLPLDYIIDHDFTKDVVTLAWPELLDFPLNQYVGLRGSYRNARLRLKSVIYKSLRALKRRLQ